MHGRVDTKYAFLDESGDVAPFTGSRFLVVAVLVVETPRPVELHVKRARQSLHRKARPDEMKASASELRVSERLLTSIADEDIAIVAVVVDKRAILRPPEDRETIYRDAVSRAVGHCLQRWPHLDLHLDRRYTSLALRRSLEKAVSESAAQIAHTAMVIWHDDSRAQLGIQAVDHVAWAIARKYEAADLRAYECIADKIVVEEVVRQAHW